ncbi:GntR family transcriptional regulator [Paenarthrobacter aurescens]|uniref:GntR family transcriptional regulator n=1 Tax=Paenarthrobacter aurescens TaxID=43663 RepID=A0A4Y3NM49_PAEAU|nr:GntR family transcriptional regulator [Paenarthrobacter aurescens]MDO6142205.1 GntR family transcriptional regulator [Paenarthrobacter aurescens]MDO6146053.1 GntR family transcriptional regulator [Paenarthrobacter aurescens]MDO6157297.1 GntR family transcriptional regulator [Paenarthrobacter aurescens]MDO6161282.1 GntR family transcriptional regulator [Paenarthrobacter aurescens]GEB20138.1 GntR family transcriptional regulator [Paenarthrobacter aurescens]
MPGRVSAVSIVDAIAADLRSRIFSGDLGPGHTLTETDVATTYEVARPTAKASIEKLVPEGLLERGTHKTARVVELGPGAVRDIYLARAYLESEVLRRLAAKKEVPEAAIQANRDIAALQSGTPLDVVEPDMRFHTSLIDAVGNERISRMYRSLVGEVRMCMVRVQTLHLLDTSLIHEEHQKILELIESGQPDAAAALLDKHLGRARERLAAAMERESGS